MSSCRASSQPGLSAYFLQLPPDCSASSCLQDFFSRAVLDREDSSLGELGGLRNQILLVLGIAALSTFVCVVAGTRCD